MVESAPFPKRLFLMAIIDMNVCQLGQPVYVATVYVWTRTKQNEGFLIGIRPKDNRMAPFCIKSAKIQNFKEPHADKLVLACQKKGQFYFRFPTPESKRDFMQIIGLVGGRAAAPCRSKL